MALQTSARHEKLRALDSGDPVNILDASAAPRVPRRPTAERRSADAGDFARNSEGRMIFREEDAAKGEAFLCTLLPSYLTVHP